MDPINKWYVIAFYILLTLGLGVGGYFAFSNNKELYAGGGVALGALISILLWFLWGQYNTY